MQKMQNATPMPEGISFLSEAEIKLKIGNDAFKTSPVSAITIKGREAILKFLNEEFGPSVGRSKPGATKPEENKRSETFNAFGNPWTHALIACVASTCFIGGRRMHF
jgi:hypothetical protein